MYLIGNITFVARLSNLLPTLTLLIRRVTKYQNLSAESSTVQHLCSMCVPCGSINTSEPNSKHDLCYKVTHMRIWIVEVALIMSSAFLGLLN
jgi:hypothetical protein